MTEDYLSKNPYCLCPRVDATVYAIPGNYKSNDTTWYNGLTEEEKKAHKAKLEKYLELPEGSLALAEPFWEKPYSNSDYLKAKELGLDLDDWNDYEKFYRLGENDENH